MKSVTARWSSGLGFKADSPDGGEVSMAGDDGVPGYRPSALLLASLAGCTGMDVISIMRKKRQPVESYQVVVSGEQRSGHPPTFSTIEVEHVFTGAGIAQDAVARAIELSATRYCPVTAHLSWGDVTIRHRYVIRDAGADRSATVVVTGPAGRGLAAGDPPSTRRSPAKGPDPGPAPAS